MVRQRLCRVADWYPATALVPVAKLMEGTESMERAYSRARILVMLGIILALILVDHLNSPTFAFNSGQGNVETALTQRDETACAPCGAPCPSTRD